MPVAAPEKNEKKAPDTRDRVREAVRKVSSIATLPEVTGRIVATVEDPKSSAAQLHKIVSYDPALVTRILKVANSAFYGLPGQVTSVERAIVLLGLNAVKNIAVAASLGQLFRGARLCEKFSARDLWRHCVAVGVTARELARRMGLPSADEAFLAGMIHDVGLLVSLQTHPEQLRTVCERAETGAADFCALERETIGMDHQQLGMGLAELWKFPLPLRLAAGYHHDPSSADEASRPLVTLVHVADTICCQSRHGFNLTAARQTVDDAMLAELGIDRAAVDETAGKLDELVEVASALFG